MAEAVAEGVKTVPDIQALLTRVGQVMADDLFSADAVVVGSPVYWSNMSGEVETFFDNLQFKIDVFHEFKMKNKVGAAFATAGQISSGKEVTMLTIIGKKVIGRLHGGRRLLIPESQSRRARKYSLHNVRSSRFP